MDAQARGEPGRPAPPGPAAASWLLARLFLRASLGRRRWLWLGLALLVPPGVGLWWRLAESGSGQAFFQELVVNLLLQVFAPGLCLVLALAAARDEIEDRTLVYLAVRPLPRWLILGGRLAAVALGAGLALGLDAVVVYILVVGADGAAGLLGGLERLGGALAGLAMLSLAYTGLFGLCGALFRRPTIPAVVLAFGWEGVVSNLPGGLPRASLMYYAKSLLGLGPEASGLWTLLLPALEPAGPGLALAALLGASVCLWVAALGIGGRREVVG